MTVYELLFTTLEARGVRYVVAGGVAAVLHGHVRLTADIDLVVDLAPDESRRAIEALTALGLKPWAPLDPLGFCDPTVRAGWVQERGMLVFTLVHPKHPLRIVDLFVESPIDFESLWSRAVIVPLGGTKARIASIADLIEMKRRSGRPGDLDDVAHLEAIQRRGQRHD